MAKVEFMYEGQKIDVYCNEKDKFSKVIQKFCSKAQKNMNDLCFLYNGKIVDINLTFFSLANSFDKERKIISLIVTDQYAKNDSKLIKENKELKEKLLEAYKKIEEQKQEIEDLKYKMTITKSEGMNQINNLMNIIEKKDKQIMELKANSKNNKISNNVTDMSNMKAICIISQDSDVNYPMICGGNQLFSEIEAKFYKEFPKYEETNCMFLCNGSVIKGFQTIDENWIKNGNTIIVVRSNDDED